MSNIIGHVIIDKETRLIDWDGEVHATREAAIDSLCSSRYGIPADFTRCEDEGSINRPYWGDQYIIGTVTAETRP